MMTRLFAAILGLGVIGNASAQELTCTVTKVDKLVEVQVPGGPWVKATTKTVLHSGDKIHTGFKSTASLTFEDGSVLDVKPMTLMVISDLEMRGNKVRTGLMLQIGEVSAQVGRKGRGASDFEVKTATCTASVRGTQISRIAFSPAQGTVVAMGVEGQLKVQTATGQVTLGKSDQSQVAKNAAPLTPGQVSSSRGQANVTPQGTTAAEAQDVRDTGVPKITPITEGGSGVVSDSPILVQPPAPAPPSDISIPLPRVP
jgi:hypothetical protein